MNDLVALGQFIKEKRLYLNLRMDDVAKQAGITRATLWSIEKGKGTCSISSLFKVLEILDISFTVTSVSKLTTSRDRASRINSAHDKKVNRFVIMCVEQYAKSINRGSGDTYRELSSSGVIRDLTDDYEDLHGMSTMYLNDYISALLKENNK